MHVTTCFLVIVFTACFIVELHSLKLDRHSKIRIGTTAARLSHAIDSIKRSSNQDGLPDDTDLHISVNGDDVYLHLHRNKRIPPGGAIYLQRDGRLQRLVLPPSKVTALYQDQETGASIELECQRQPNVTSCTHLVRGSFQFGNRTLLLEPEDNDDDRALDDGAMHVLYESHENNDFYSDYLIPERKGGGRTAPGRMVEARRLFPKSAREKRAAMLHQVEFLSVVDFPIYEFWYNMSSAVDPAARQAEALADIREFYSFVLNAVDIRYQTIVSTQIAIQIIYAGIVVADTPLVSTWTEENLVTVSGGRDQVDSSLALNAFRTWLGGQTELPDYDHAMAFTGYDLTSAGSGTANAGLAWLDGACEITGPSPTANSITEDHFQAGIATVAAHELGHNLGSQHDGTGNACLADDKFVMSPSSGGITDERAVNHWSFSTCSTTQFETYIASLNAENNNCLLTTSPGYDPNALDAYADLLAGQMYDIDVQCELKLGPGSYFCRSLYTDYAALCPVMWCRVPGESTCRTTIPWEGTTCGNKKVCLSGVCTCDSRGPSVLDTCPLGDQPGVVASGLTCAEVIGGFAGYCNQTYFAGRCCGSCHQASTGIPGCEYGDRITGCSPSQCAVYDADTLADCCLTCGATTTAAPTFPPSSCAFDNTTTPTVTTVTAWPSTTSTTISEPTTTAPPTTTVTNGGEMSALDELCESVVGAGSSMCRYFHYADYTTVCSNLYCHTPGDQGTCTGIIPPDMTSCSSGMWCVGGTCVDDAGSPTLPCPCAFGDEVAAVVDQRTCSDVIHGNPNNCYETSWQGMCCDSCHQYYTGVQGCEYGDRSTQCMLASCSSYDVPTRTSVCCQTCSEGFTTAVPPGCVTNSPSTTASTAITTNSSTSTPATITATSNTQPTTQHSTTTSTTTTTTTTTTTPTTTKTPTTTTTTPTITTTTPTTTTTTPKTTTTPTTTTAQRNESTTASSTTTTATNNSTTVSPTTTIYTGSPTTKTTTTTTTTPFTTIAPKTTTTPSMSTTTSPTIIATTMLCISVIFFTFIQ